MRTKTSSKINTVFKRQCKDVGLSKHIPNKLSKIETIELENYFSSIQNNHEDKIKLNIYLEQLENKYT